MDKSGQSGFGHAGSGQAGSGQAVQQQGSNAAVQRQQTLTRKPQAGEAAPSGQMGGSTTFTDWASI
jgi:hypothetical protein